jgi:hypothetical protein
MAPPNERPSLARHVTFFSWFLTELSKLNLLRAYPSDAIQILSSFDYDSITMLIPSEYAKPGTTLYTTLQQQSPRPATNQAGLSYGDCLAIASLYQNAGCDPKRCDFCKMQFFMASQNWDRIKISKYQNRVKNHFGLDVTLPENGLKDQISAKKGLFNYQP